MGVQVREKPPGSGVWWVFIHHKGVRKSKRVGALEPARKVAEQIQARLVLGHMDIRQEEVRTAPLFKDYAAIWLEDYIKPLRRVSTYNRYLKALKKHINPAIGNTPIDQVKRKDIRAFILKHHKAGASRASLAMFRDVISGILGYAVDEELLDANPVAGILKRLHLERDKHITIEPLTATGVDLLLTACARHAPEWYEFFLTSCRTGMRLGEILALEWGDIDFAGNFIRVNKAFRRGRVEKPKNGKDRRVDMSDQLKQALKALLIQRKREALQSGMGEPVEIIFHTGGKHTAQNSVRNVFKRVLKKADLRQVRVHDLRHTFASLLLSNGESPVYVKEQLGHSSINITVDIYGHLIPSSNRQAVNRLDSSAPNRTPDATTENTKAASY